MHLCPGNVVAIGRGVVYYVRAAQTFSAGIKCRHCTPVFGWPDVFTPELLIQLILNPTHPSMEDIFGMCGDVQKAKRDYVCALYDVGIAKIAPKMHSS